MKRARREFLKTTAAGALFGITGGSRLDAGQMKPAIPMPTERAKALMALFGLKYPIFEAPHGRQTCPDLAIAVSNAGAMGALAGLRDPDDARGLVSKVRAATKAPFLVNFLLSVVPMSGNEPAALRSVLDAGAPIIHFSWGMPSKEAVAAIRSAGAKMGMQVTSAESARAALDLGADYLVCQGTEAGGHVQATRTLYETLPLVLKEAGEKPVVAAGGIGNGQGIREALSAGASAAMLGTRFLATIESNAHPEYKQALVAATAKDTALTNCFQDGWPAMHRALRNRTFVMWDAAGCPPPGKRPGEGDVIAAIPGGTKFLRYNSRSPLREYSGLVTECALYAGRSVEFVKDLPAAGELVKRLWRECEAAADVSSIGPDKKS